MEILTTAVVALAGTFAADRVSSYLKKRIDSRRKREKDVVLFVRDSSGGSRTISVDKHASIREIERAFGLVDQGLTVMKPQDSASQSHKKNGNRRASMRGTPGAKPRT